MTYTHLTPNELVMIEAYFKKGIVVLEAAKLLRRSRQTIYNVYNFLKLGKTETTEWLKNSPKNLFKSITFDCGKEFSNWKNMSNSNDISIYFADPGTPSQRGLNEHSNGLLRKDGLPKTMDFNQVDQAFVSAVASKRNHIPRKSLKYQTPLEVFLSYLVSTE